MRFVSFIAAALIAAGTVVLVSQRGDALTGNTDPDESHVQMSTIASRDALVPGETIHLGVRFTLDPKWHIYWINGGQAGLPTTIDVKAPESVTVGEPMFPAPIRFVDPFGIEGIGYEDEVMVLIPITLDQEAEMEEVELRITGEWLVCKDVCIPGSATNAITLPVAATAEARHQALFTAWHARVPVEAGEDAPATATLRQAEQRVTLQVAWDEPVEAVDFAPFEHPKADVEAIKVVHAGRESTITYTLSPFAGEELMPSPGGVVTYAEDETHRKGIAVEAVIEDQ